MELQEPGDKQQRFNGGNFKKCYDLLKIDVTLEQLYQLN